MFSVFIINMITLQSLTGPVQGQNRVFDFHTGKTLFLLAGIPVMKTGFSLLEILHRENPVLSRDGFAVKLFEEIVYCAELNNFAQYIFTLLQDVFQHDKLF